MIWNLIVGEKAPMSDNSRLYIGKDFSCIGAEIFLHDEKDLVVNIGDDCQFSFDIIIWPSDGHTIIDKDKRAINKGKSINIGNHVWIGMDSKILKGSNIPDNSVVGASSVYTASSNHKIRALGGGGIMPVDLALQTGFIFAGQPAKVVKSDINWHRLDCYQYEKNLQTDLTKIQSE